MESGLTDTYYAIEPMSGLVSAGSVAVGLLAAWWVILRIAARQPRRLFALAMSAYVAGCVLLLLPFERWLAQTDHLPTAIYISTLGGFASGFGVLLTSVVLVWTVLAAVIDRL